MRVSCSCSVRSASAQWTPSSLSPWAWLDSRAGVVLDGSSKVSQWSDLSGLGHHAKQSSYAVRPVVSNPEAYNGQPVVDFTGTSFLVCDAAMLTQPFTVVWVGTAPHDTVRWLWSGSAIDPLEIYQSSSNLVLIAGGRFDIPTTEGGPRICTFAINGTSSYIRQRSKSGTVASQTGTCGSAIITRMVVGANSSSGLYPLNGVMLGMLVIPKSLSASEISLVESYYRASGVFS